MSGNTNILLLYPVWSFVLQSNFVLNSHSANEREMIVQKNVDSRGVVTVNL